MKLMATTDNGTRSINDQFDVVPNAAFDVSRSGPTRINPTHTYPMTMRITPANDWSGKVKEIVPASFEVTPPVNSIPYESVEEENGVKVITWNLDLVAGEESVIGYYLKAPPVSPEFYFLGPLAFYDEATDTKLFQEKREWQVASDLVCTSQVTTGNWNTAGTWNCGHVPTTGEDVVIGVGPDLLLRTPTGSPQDQRLVFMAHSLLRRYQRKGNVRRLSSCRRSTGLVSRRLLCSWSLR